MVVPLYKIAEKITSNSRISLWLSFGFIFSTAYVGLAILPRSWYYAQILSTTLILAAIYEFLKISDIKQISSSNIKKWLLVGTCIGLAVTVRTYLFFTAIFFILEIYFSKINIKEKIRSLILLCIPIGFCILLFFLYNFRRFHNIFETGYTRQTAFDMPIVTATLKYGFWNIVHIPMQLYYLFIKGPDAIFIPGTQMLQFPFYKPDPFGMSILYTSPMFLWLVKAPFKNKTVIFSLITSCLIELTIIGYFGTGYRQFGYRYAIDYYPFLFLTLLYTVKKWYVVYIKNSNCPFLLF